MGTGGIASAMAGVLRDRGSPIAAVGSARPGAAQRFADNWGIPIATDSHAGVLARDEVDIVYVATTNDRHYENVLDAIAAKKHVLCEKPLALNLEQARTMFSAARQAGVMLMEAMWMQFLPHMEVMKRLLSEGTIGPFTHIEASFGILAPAQPARRWFSRGLGGGALLDLGIYPLTLVHHLAGPPVRFETLVRRAATGVDRDTRCISHHDGGVSASAAASLGADLANEAIVAGSKGRIRLHAPFHHTSLITVERHGRIVATHETGFDGHGFQYEVAEMERCIALGLLESTKRTPADTLAVMSWMDDIRQRGGVTFSADDPG